MSPALRSGLLAVRRPAHSKINTYEKDPFNILVGLYGMVMW